MYDQTVTKTMSGTLVRLIPGSSHSQIVFDLMDAEGKPTLAPDGKPVKWQVELGSAANIARHDTHGVAVSPTQWCESGGDCGSARALRNDDASGRLHASDRHRHEATRELTSVEASR